MNHTLHLYRLQLIDSALEKAEKEIASLQAKIDSDKRIQQAKAEVEAQMNRQYKTETAIKSTESIIHDFNVKLEINQSSLYSGRFARPRSCKICNWKRKVFDVPLRKMKIPSLSS